MIIVGLVLQVGFELSELRGNAFLRGAEVHGEALSPKVRPSGEQDREGWSEIEKVRMEEGRRSRQQLLREQGSLSFCLEDQTSFCNRKFSTAASRNETTTDDDDDDVSWLK